MFVRFITAWLKDLNPIIMHWQSCSANINKLYTYHMFHRSFVINHLQKVCVSQISSFVDIITNLFILSTLFVVTEELLIWSIVRPPASGSRVNMNTNLIFFPFQTISLIMSFRLYHLYHVIISISFIAKI